jgi:hypothetical protein
MKNGRERNEEREGERNKRTTENGEMKEEVKTEKMKK